MIWMGPDLAPWLEDAVATLSAGAQVLTLLEADETMRLEFREGALFETHGHDDHEAEHDHDDAPDDHEHEDEHDHDEEHEADHDHDEEHEAEHDHDDHADEGDGSDHDHGDHDPHAWLAPSNAIAWLDLIAAELSSVDPENAGLYSDNAAEARSELEALTAEVNAILEPVRGLRFIVFHDAYQYFELAFDMPASGAISISDAANPSPARIAEIQARVADEGIDCVLSEPQFNASLVKTVLDGTEAGTAVIDPIGVALEPGPGLYPALIRDMATALTECR